MIRRLLFHIVSYTAAFFTAAWALPGITVPTHPLDLAVVGAAFLVIGGVVKPILKLIFVPVIILTLGLFLIIINAIALYLTDLILPTLTISGVETLLLGSLLISAVHFLLYHVLFKPFVSH